MSASLANPESFGSLAEEKAMSTNDSLGYEDRLEENMSEQVSSVFCFIVIPIFYSF